MLSIYPAIFFKEENGYSVIFPDLNYLSTCGENLNEAMEMAVDCLAGYLYEADKSGEEIPKSSEISEINVEKFAQELKCDSKNALINLVSVDVKEYAKVNFEKSVKKTLSIPSWLNKIATEQKINFSKVLQEALISVLNLELSNQVTT